MMRLTRRVLLIIAALACAQAAQAQSDKPVRFILPVATASGVDTITRTTANALSKSIGNPIVIENQPGAGGMVGTSALVKSAPDGYTLSMVSNNHVIYPSVYKSVPFDPLGDITPIAVIGATPLVLVANPKVPATNAKELAALIKAKPGSYNYASSGNGTILHLSAEMFLDEAGLQAKHIPYKGVGPMVTDLIGGQVEFGVVSLPSVQAHIKSGALRVLAIGSVSRNAAAPDVPTFVEQGFPNLVMDAWFAMVAPKGLPLAEVKRLNLALQTAFATPEVKEAMAKQGNSINISTPEQAVSFFRSESLRYAKLVKKAGLELQ
jgi:tripartite-type tricarboxylate transporter receptor subunit TctC